MTSASSSSSPASTPVSTVSLTATETAASFIDSVGVNMHSGMASADLPYAYRDVGLVEDALQYLNVTHIRDGIGAGFGKSGYDYTTITETYLAERGYKFDFPISTLAPFEITALHTFASRFPGALESVEGPNEANSWGIDGAKAFQQSLFDFVHSDPLLQNVTVMDFTLAYATTHYLDGYGDLSSISDEGNVHIYGTYGRSPSAFGQWLSVAQAATPGSPMNVTETGYSTLPSNAQWGVDETTQSKYILNTLMDAAQNNVSMTYLYELLDRNAPNPSSPIQEHYGLFRADGTPKPAADAIHNLMTILDTGSKPTSDLGKLDVSFNKPLDKGVHTLLIQKSAGTYDLVLWAEPNVWDPNKQAAIQAPKISVDLSFSGATAAALYDPLVGTAPLRILDDPRASSVIEVTDHPVIIEVTLGAPVAQSVVQTRTNGVVTKEVVTYAPNPSEISTTRIFNANGVLTSETQLHADHSKDVYLSAIAGKSYVAEHDAYNAAGTLVEATRSHADGSLDYHYLLNAAGTKITDAYDAAGLQKSHVEARADGYLDTITFKDGLLSRDVVKYAPGGPEASDTRVYANVGGQAVLTQETLLHTDGSKDVLYTNIAGKAYSAEHDSYDVSGTLIHQTRTFAGHEVQTYELASDGTKITDSYDAGGVRTLHTEMRANGASDTLTYKNGLLASEVIKFAPGGPETSETKSYTAVDGRAVLTQDTLLHAGGAKDVFYTNIAGKAYSAEHDSYDAKGTLIHQTRTFAGHELQTYDLAGNGTKTSDSYDAAGVHTLHAEVRANGASDTLTYKNGVLASEVIKFAPGGAETSETKSYTAVDGRAVLTQDTLLHASGAKDVIHANIAGKAYSAEHDSYDAEGTLIHQTRTFAGHELQTYDLAGNGTKTSDSYDATGVHTLHAEVRANGASDTLTYKSGVLASEVVKFAPGGAETSETKSYTAVGGRAVLTSDSQVHADATKDVYATPADSVTAGYAARHTAYDAAGKVLFTDQTNSDGSHTQTAGQAGVTLASTAGLADTFRSYGSDTFAFAKGFGHDVVSGFHAGAGSAHDVLLLDTSQVHDFAELREHMSASGRDTLIDLGGGDTILLKAVAPGALTPEDVHFQDHGLFLA